MRISSFFTIKTIENFRKNIKMQFDRQEREILVRGDTSHPKKDVQTFWVDKDGMQTTLVLRTGNIFLGSYPDGRKRVMTCAGEGNVLDFFVGDISIGQVEYTSDCTGFKILSFKIYVINEIEVQHEELIAALLVSDQEALEVLLRSATKLHTSGKKQVADVTANTTFWTPRFSVAAKPFFRSSSARCLLFRCLLMPLAILTCLAIGGITICIINENSEVKMIFCYLTLGFCLACTICGFVMYFGQKKSCSGMSGRRRYLRLVGIEDEAWYADIFRVWNRRISDVDGCEIVCRKDITLGQLLVLIGIAIRAVGNLM